MLNSLRWFTLLLGLSGLWACSAPADHSERTPTSRQQPPSAVRQQIQTLEKAKQLSNTVTRTEETRQQMGQEESK